MTNPSPALDTLRRPLHDLRISVTDRCNFRCRYCMPREVFGPDFQFLPRSEILSYEEIARVARVAHGLGVRKIRITGGEPLLRRGLTDLVAQLSKLPGVELALTTNGVLLPRQARPLADAGLDRVTVSLDALDDEVFRRMNDARVPVARVLEGIEAARQADLRPVKVNAVVRRGLNDAGVVDLARHFQGTGVILRFIEFMDVGTTNAWSLEDVVPGEEILRRIGEEMPLEPVPPRYPGEVATRFRYVDGSGEVGVITSVTRPFCGGCTRARLSAEGTLYTCLFAARGTDLKTALRGGANDDDLADLLGGVWARRDDRYSEIRSTATGELPKIEMSYIGG